MPREHRWVALLRAVNLGARNKVPMAELRRVLEEQGCESVRTYIQSGNAVFASALGRDALARQLEQGIEDAFGVATPVMLRSPREIARVVGAHPFGPGTSRTQVAFLARKPGPAKARGLEALDIEPDRVEVVGSDVYLHLPNGVGGARLSGAHLQRALGVPATVRNWRTVARLAEMAAEE